MREIHSSASASTSVRAVVAYLAIDASPSKQAEFLRCGQRIARSRQVEPVPIVRGADLVELGEEQAPRSIDHLIIICHGGPDWLINSRRGVHATAAESAAHGRVSAARLAGAWAPALKPGGLVSLCACLCSRSPKWWLVQAGGWTGNDWGAAAYRDGGERSFSAALRDELSRRGAPVAVRGHGTVGHVLYNPILREHGPEVGSAGRSLFGIALPGREPTARARAAWIGLARGELAEAWLLGDDSAAARIAGAWASGCGA